jgi:D-glycero-alpha-D-manno-heptose 1-phosphate guanylyltransferase
VIEEYVKDEMRNSPVKFSIEKEPLGTGGAIKRACDHAAEETVLVLNGDTFFKVDLDKLVPFHHMCGADCTLSLKPMKNFDRYGVVGLNKDYSIESFQEKKFYTEGLINGGVYALNVKKFKQENLPEKFSFEKDYLEAFYPERRMYSVIQDEYFIDIGIPEDYERAQRELLANVKM